MLSKIFINPSWYQFSYLLCLGLVVAGCCGLVAYQSKNITVKNVFGFIACYIIPFVSVGLNFLNSFNLVYTVGFKKIVLTAAYILISLFWIIWFFVFYDYRQKRLIIGNYYGAKRWNNEG